jgi:chromosome segregation ATPase
LFPCCSILFPCTTTYSHIYCITGGPNIKRSRTDYSAEEEELEEDNRTQEIQSLKAENSKLSDNLTQLQSEHDKVSHENRLLKKLVTHQHERQQHLQNELEKANKYKLETEERMRKMEQMILQLRYHLSTAGSKPDFINQYRPPDVY